MCFRFLITVLIVCSLQVSYAYAQKASGYAYEENDNFKPGLFEAIKDAAVYYDIDSTAIAKNVIIKKGTLISVYSAGYSLAEEPSTKWFNLSFGKECNGELIPWGKISWIGVLEKDFRRIKDLPGPIYKKSRITNCDPASYMRDSIGKTANLKFPSPSFDCRKAATKTEKSICANENLANIDKNLAKIWKSFLYEFDEITYKDQLKKEQSLWIKLRNKCNDDVKCIEKTYQQRIDLLSGKQSQRQFAGQFEVAKEGAGGITIYPVEDGSYLVRIQTVEPVNARWVCDITGKAAAKGSLLTITVDNKSFPAFLKGPGLLEIPAIKEVYSVESDYCGWNGNIAYDYLRVPLGR